MTETSETTAARIAAAVQGGDRRALAQAITLVESALPRHRAAARALLAAVAGRGDALRLGLSGAPGVGKSTLIEHLGMALVRAGRRVAVLAVDPSSTRDGGAILGDKTRMDRLAREGAAYIRPSPSGGALGGVARRTREALALVEAAGFDVCIVETVGVGQSETMVADMTDVFALVVAPGGGDDLQGVKRGIMEAADLVLVNKADGALAEAARVTAGDYGAALRLMRRRPHDPDGYPRALCVSALAESGLEAAWAAIAALDEARRAAGWRMERRRAQAVRWMHAEIEAGLRATLARDARARALMPALEARVADGLETPEAAAATVLALFGAAP